MDDVVFVNALNQRGDGTYRLLSQVSAGGSSVYQVLCNGLKVDSGSLEELVARWIPQGKQTD